MHKIFFHFADGHTEDFFAVGDTRKLQAIAKDWWRQNGEVATIAHGEVRAITFRPASGSERMPVVAALRERNAL